jgi:hypothetical protein
MVRIIVFLILFPTNSIAKDYLFDEMVKNWSSSNECANPNNEYADELPAPDIYEDVLDNYDSGYDSWDNLYLDHYEDTEIIY